jgi:hypothetical protein
LCAAKKSCTRRLGHLQRLELSTPDGASTQSGWQDQRSIIAVRKPHVVGIVVHCELVRLRIRRQIIVSFHNAVGQGPPVQPPEEKSSALARKAVKKEIVVLTGLTIRITMLNGPEFGVVGFGGGPCIEEENCDSRGRPEQALV